MTGTSTGTPTGTSNATLAEAPARRRSGVAAEPPHPRIRARRIEVRRDEGRRRRQRLLALAAFLALAVAVAGLTRSSALDVDHVSITGAGHTPAASVRRAIGIRRGQPMMEVDGRSAAARLRALPWVDHAVVTRSWPGTIKVRLTERHAVAQVRGPAGGWALVDPAGRVLRLSVAPVPAVVHVQRLVAGAPGTFLADTAGSALRLARELPPSIAGGVESITTHAAGSLTMELRAVDGADPIAVQIGPASQLEAKVEALAALLASVDRSPPIATIDVTVPGAAVLTRTKLDQGNGGA